MRRQQKFHTVLIILPVAYDFDFFTAVSGLITCETVVKTDENFNMNTTENNLQGLFFLNVITITE